MSDSDNSNTDSPDPFDPESLRLTDATSFGVEKVLTTIPVRKPGKQEWVRVHPNPEYRLTTAVILDEGNRDETYLVDPALRDAVVGEAIPVNLLTAITRHGDLFLWQLKLPKDGRSTAWYESASAGAELAVNDWIRITSNMNAQCYDVVKATGPIPDPEWPELKFNEILRIAFKNRFIDAVDHPLLKALRGEV